MTSSLSFPHPLSIIALRWREILLTSTALILAFATDVSLVGSFIPFFFIASDSCGGGGGGGGGADGDSGSDTGGSGSSSCGTCASGDADAGGGSSTPYLYIKERGTWKMLNDVMVGNPTSYFKDRSQADLHFKAGMVGADNYPVALSSEHQQAGAVKMMLKEIEPEESFLQQLTVRSLVVPSGYEPLQGWDHETIHVVSSTERKPATAVILNNTEDITKKLNATAVSEHDTAKSATLRLNKGDTLTFSVNREQGGALIVSSFWRDWVAGLDGDAIHGLATKVRSVPFFQRVSTKVAMAVSMIAGIFFGGTSVSTQTFHVPDSETLSLIKKMNTPIAHADTPHSSGGGGDSNCLVVSYKSPEHGLWVHIATIQPRAYLPTDLVVALPEAAYDQKGQASIMIEATRPHYIAGISTAPQSAITKEVESTEEKVIGRQYRAGDIIANEKGADTTEQLHLIAGDRYEFTAAVRKDATHVVLKAHGYYTPLSKEGEQTAGDWRAELDKREMALMESIYG